MKVADLRAKTDDQLTEELLGLRKERFNLRFQKTSGQLEATAGVRVARRAIARIKTIQSERRLGLVIEAAPKKEKKVAKPKVEKKQEKPKAEKAGKKKPEAGKKTARKK